MKCNLLRALGTAIVLPAFLSCAALQDSAAVEDTPLPSDWEETLPADSEWTEAQEAEATFVDATGAAQERAEDGPALDLLDEEGSLLVEEDGTARRDNRRVALYGGARSYSDDLWDDADGGFALGIDYSQLGDDGLGFDAGLLGYISSEDGDVNGATAELYGGVRKAFDYGQWQPYVGAGAALVLAGLDDEQGSEVADDLEVSPGLYLRAGILYDIDEKFFVGFDLRALTATDFDFTQGSGDANYIQGLVSFGLRL